MISVTGVDKIIRQMLLNYDTATQIVVGPGGVGKTHQIAPTFTKELSKFINKPTELLIYRLQGLDETDTQGIPYRHTAGYLSYLLPKEIKRIIDNPDIHFVLALDEVDRAAAEMKPILFKFFERVIEGAKSYSNVSIIAMINGGGELGDEYGEYDSNIDFDDPALCSRVIFYKYLPNKQDILDFMTVNNYESVILDVVTSIRNRPVWSYSRATQFEAVTTLRSYANWDKRLKNIYKLDGYHVKDANGITRQFTLDEVINDFVSYGNLYFNSEMLAVINRTLNDLKNLFGVDIIEEVVKKGVIPPKLQQNKAEVKLRIAEQVISYMKTNPKSDLIKKYNKNIIDLLRDNKDLLINTINNLAELNEEFLYELMETITQGDSDENAELIRQINRMIGL